MPPNWGLRQDAEYQTIRQRVLTRGANDHDVPVTLAATTVAITFRLMDYDANYGAVATPNWGTTCWITTKITTGFTINFGTAAPANATVDWTTFRREN